MKTKLCLLGFSTRALARAAVDAGYSANAIDYFQDQDLQGACDWFQPWPADTVEIPTLIRSAPSSELVVLAGGTEDLGAELGELCHSHDKRTSEPSRPTVLGPTPKQLAMLRDPVNLAQLSRGTGVYFPASLIPSNGDASRQTMKFGVEVDFGDKAPAAGAPDRWLQKPKAGAGGWKIAEVDDACQLEDEAYLSHRDEEVYLQQFVPGRSLGITCLLVRDQQPMFLGATQSWDSSQWPGPTPFIYRGSWGPVSLTESQIRSVLRFATKVQSQTGLLGWLPMDFVESPDGKLWLLEINPRWTAGMEVLHDCGLNVLPLHLATCLAPDVAEQVSPVGVGFLRAIKKENLCKSSFLRGLAAKAIVYAEKNIELNQGKLAEIHSLPRTEFADLPARVDVIEEGQPILTVKTRLEGVSHEDGQETMLTRLQALRQRVLELVLR